MLSPSLAAPRRKALGDLSNKGQVADFEKYLSFSLKKCSIAETTSQLQAPARDAVEPPARDVALGQLAGLLGAAPDVPIDKISQAARSDGGIIILRSTEGAAALGGALRESIARDAPADAQSLLRMIQRVALDDDEQGDIFSLSADVGACLKWSLEVAADDDTVKVTLDTVAALCMSQTAEGLSFGPSLSTLVCSSIGSRKKELARCALAVVAVAVQAGVVFDLGLSLTDAAAPVAHALTTHPRDEQVAADGLKVLRAVAELPRGAASVDDAKAAAIEGIAELLRAWGRGNGEGFAGDASLREDAEEIADLLGFELAVSIGPGLSGEILTVHRKS